MGLNVGVWHGFSKNFAVFIINAFLPCFVSIEPKLIFFEQLTQNFFRDSLCH